MDICKHKNAHIMGSQVAQKKNHLLCHQDKTNAVSQS